MPRHAALAVALMLSACAPTTDTGGADEAGWVSLFDGETLDGWVPNFAGEPVGVNYRDVFQADNGVLRVDYTGWDSFDGKFGHIFSDRDYAAYDLRFEYRMFGEQVPGAPDWALRNNGVMLHAQAPETMALEQGFPRCLELQLLNGGGVPERSTGNICTPGTFVILDGELDRAHCISSPKPEISGEDWIAVRAEVNADGSVRYFVDGEETFAIDAVVVQTDDPMVPASGLDELTPIRSGRIAFQAESHPTEFRNIQIREH